MTAASATATRVAMLVLATALGCMHKRGAAPTSADASPASGSIRSELDDLAQAQAELAANKAELAALGVQIASRRERNRDDAGNALPRASEPPEPEPETPTIDPVRGQTTTTNKPSSVHPEPKPTPDQEKDDSRKASDSGSCRRICMLAGVACDLSKRICQLADDHQGDARYEDACWNAGQQCEDASDACSDCTAC